MKKELTPKQKLFCDEYLVDLNATQAAKRAGYSEKTSNEQGARLLAKASVQEYLNSKKTKRSEKLEIKTDEILGETKILAHADIRELFDESGHLIPIHKLPDSIARAISSFEIVTKTLSVNGEAVPVEYAHKFKFWDKKGSLELLGKHMKLFTDKVELTGKDGGAIEVNSQEAAAKLATLLESVKSRKK